MGRLQQLYLQHTQIRGSGLVHLEQLSGLEVLDLSSTQIDDGHLLHVLKFPALKTLYLHDTAVNPVIVEAMQRNHPDLEIHWVRGTYF
jgi:Leucine-rich repeat (LRR) protein